MAALDQDKQVIATQEQEPKSPADPRTWNQKFVMGDDKVKHSVAGFVMTMTAFALLTKGFKVSKVKVFIVCAVIAVLFAAGAMFGKESFWDGYLGQGFPDIWDFWCGLILIPLAIALIAVFGYILWRKGELKE